MARFNFHLEAEQKLFYQKAAAVAGYKELAPWIRMVLEREAQRVAEQQGRE
jgi:hypothetical protein